MRIVESDGAEGFRDPEFVLSHNPFDPDAPPRPEYFVEARLPLGEPAVTRGGARSKDMCRQSPGVIEGALAPTEEVAIDMTRVSETARFATYRTVRPLVFLDARLTASESAPHLPLGPAYVQLPPGGRIRPVAFADEETEGAEEREPTPTKLRFFSACGRFRDELIKALSTATTLTVFCDDAGYVAMPPKKGAENAAATLLRGLVEGATESRVERKLQTLEGILGGTKLRGRLILWTDSTGFSQDIRDQAAALAESYYLMIRDDVSSTEFKKELDPISGSGPRDVIILNIHAGTQGLRFATFPSNDDLLTPELTDLVRRSRGPGVFGVSGCFSLEPNRIFPTSGSSQLGLGTNSPNLGHSRSEAFSISSSSCSSWTRAATSPHSLQ